MNKLTSENKIHEIEMRYGNAIKDSVIKRILPSDAENIRSVSLDTGISDQTIHYWLAKFNQGIIRPDAPLGPRQLGEVEKFNLLLESRSLSKEELRAWIREKGLHTEHLQ